MEVKINITPMSLKNGVLGLPIHVCRNWDASGSVIGRLIYAGVSCDITFSPKHIKWENNAFVAEAWQFTVNNSVQYSQLKQDGVYTYATEKKNGEKLICDFSVDSEGVAVLKVLSVEKHEETPELKKLAQLLRQGIRPESEEKNSGVPIWNAPAEWTDFSEIKKYDDVKDCIYLWLGERENDDTVYLYVGIVGDTVRNGESKRTLAKRLGEEQKKYSREYGVNIKKFRYCSLNNPNGMNVPNMLKTIEMAEITVLSSLFYCANARDNIKPAFADQRVVLLNKSTSFKFVE